MGTLPRSFLGNRHLALEPLPGNLFLGTCLEACWEPCLGTWLGNLLLGNPLRTLLGSLAWEPEATSGEALRTLLGNLAWKPCLETLLANLAWNLAWNPAWEPVPGNLGNLAWEPCLGILLGNLAWDPAVGNLAWGPCLGPPLWEAGNFGNPGCSDLLRGPFYYGWRPQASAVGKKTMGLKQDHQTGIVNLEVWDLWTWAKIKQGRPYFAQHREPQNHMQRLPPTHFSIPSTSLIPLLLYFSLSLSPLFCSLHVSSLRIPTCFTSLRIHFSTFFMSLLSQLLYLLHVPTF